MGLSLWATGVLQDPVPHYWLPAGLTAVLETPNGLQYVKDLFDTSGTDVNVRLPGMSSSGGSSDSGLLLAAPSLAKSLRILSSRMGTAPVGC